VRTRTITCLTGLFLLCAAVAVAAPSPGNSAEVPDKESQPTGVPTYEGRIEGDTIETAFKILYFPFTDSMDTCPFLHDYDECCPYTGSMSPDVVYEYYCQNDRSIDIDLCASSYDTKVFVYENAHGNLVGCNDDMLGCGPSGYQSLLSVELNAGNTYYIVIDGYGSDCGTYELYISPSAWIRKTTCTTEAATSNRRFSTSFSRARTPSTCAAQAGPTTSPAATGETPTGTRSTSRRRARSRSGAYPTSI